MRALRRRHARRTGEPELTYREIAASTGWSHGIVGEYLAGRALPPTDRFDALIRLLGATPAEQGALATARDRVAETRRRNPPADATVPTRVPRQLPGDISGFTGRANELADLNRLLGGDDDPAAIICLVAGTAGVGKTTLAVHWAHRVAAHFPDGQLYVDLRGYDEQPPLPPSQVLARFVRSLGVPAADLPADVDELAAGYRTLLAGRRMLVLLDNASGVDQIRPLLPGASGCLVLVTSRDGLAGLVAREGARRIDLDILTEPEAVALLRAAIGGRVDSEPEAAVRLARLCAHLPLALRVAAQTAVAHPGRTLGELENDLLDEARRLDRLSADGDPRTAVRTVFSWSCQHLTAGAEQAFGLLGLHPGREFDQYDVAALADTDLGVARAAIDELVQAHLLKPAGDGMFTMHDLLRAYAAERAPDRDAPMSRLFDQYLHTAAVAADTLFPHDRAASPVVAPACSPTPAVESPAEALSWLDRHRLVLVSMARLAAGRAWPRYSVDLSRILWRYFEVGGHYQEALAVHASAEEAAQRDLGGVAGRGLPSVLANLGNVYWWLGDYRDALIFFERALAGHRAAGDRDGEARALARLGVVHERLGDHVPALARLEEALAIYRAAEDRHGEGVQLLNLGSLHRRCGRYQQATTQHELAAALFTALGDRRLEGYALGNLGADYSLLGRHAAALAHLRQALAHCEASADRGGRASAIAAIGVVYQRMGQFPLALAHLTRALARSHDVSDRALETEVLNSLGETLLAIDDPAAVEHHRAALALTERTGDQFERARALDGIAQAYQGDGEVAQAREHWRQALEIYARLGTPEAETVRENLSSAAR